MCCFTLFPPPCAGGAWQQGPGTDAGRSLGYTATGLALLELVTFSWPYWQSITLNFQSPYRYWWVQSMSQGSTHTAGGYAAALPTFLVTWHINCWPHLLAGCILQHIAHLQVQSRCLYSASTISYLFSVLLLWSPCCAGGHMGEWEAPGSHHH